MPLDPDSKPGHAVLGSGSLVAGVLRVAGPRHSTVVAEPRFHSDSTGMRTALYSAASSFGVSGR